jgi:hypothetical protein
MIPSQELRIGNWVSKNSTSVDPIQLNRKLFEWAVCQWVCKDIYPIPLSPEILEKAGFSKELFYYEKDEICIREIEGKFYALAMWVPLESETNILIDSVHYLQNFYFFIVGRELNLEL